MKITKTDNFQPFNIKIENENDMKLLLSTLTNSEFWIITRDKKYTISDKTDQINFIKEIRTGLGYEPGLL